MPVELTQPELATHEKIRVLIQGNARAGQHARDAFHPVESAKYGRHFITNDGRCWLEMLRGSPTQTEAYFC